MLYSSPKQAQLAHPRHVTLQVGTSSIVHKIIIGTTATAPNEHVLFMTRPLPPRTTHSKSNTHLWCGFAVPGTLLWYDTPIQKTPSLILSQHHHHHNKFVLIQHHHNDWPRSERATEWTIGRVCACVPRLYHLIVPSDAFVVAFDTCCLHSVAIASRPSLP